MKRIWIAGLAGATVLLAGCGGAATPAPAAPSAETSSAAPAPSASSSAPTEAPAPSASSAAPTGASAKLKDPCDVISVKEMAKITDTNMKSQRSTSVMGTKLCTYVPDSLSDPSVTVQGGEYPGDFTALLTQLQTTFKNAKVTKINIGSTDQAVVLTGKLAGVNAADVVAGKGGVYYQALIAGNGKTDDYQKSMTEVVEQLFAG